MTEPIEYRDWEGGTRWQPVLNNGERYWDDYFFSIDVWESPRPEDENLRTPHLTSYRKAVRMAEKEERRRVRDERRKFQEVR